MPPLCNSFLCGEASCTVPGGRSGGAHRSTGAVFSCRPLAANDAMELQKTSIVAHSITCPGVHGTYDRDLASCASAPQLAACVLVRCGRSVLLTQRSKSLRTFPGLWVVPGGSVDSGETARDAAARELQEECGIAIPTNASLPLLGVWESCFPTVPASVPPRRHHVVLYFIFDVLQRPEVHLSAAECEQHCWVDVGEPPVKTAPSPSATIINAWDIHPAWAPVHDVVLDTSIEMSEGTRFMVCSSANAQSGFCGASVEYVNSEAEA